MAGLKCETLTLEQVKKIHQTLVDDFARSKDPIDPPGIRGHGELLESAVARQLVSYGQDYKYPDAISNAATLCYGICCNHAFHNGNKRAALVSMLCHLDANNLMIKEDLNQRDLYSFMLKVASHKYALRRKGSDTSDKEVEEIGRWLRRSTRKLKKGEKIVTFRELRKILRAHDIHLENPSKNYIDVIKYEMKRPGLFKPKQRVGQRVAHIPYPREGMVVGRKVLKTVRKSCRLSEEDGYDTEMFYGAEVQIDKFIVRYKKTLRRLAKI